MKNTVFLVALVFVAIGCVSAEDHADEFESQPAQNETSGAAGAPVIVSGSGGAMAQPSSAGGTTGAAGAPVISGSGGAMAQPSSAGGTTGAAGAPVVVSGAGGALGSYGDACPAWQVGGDPRQVYCKSGVCAMTADGATVCGCKYTDECNDGGHNFDICESGLCKSNSTIYQETLFPKSYLDLKIRCRTVADCAGAPYPVSLTLQLVCGASGMCETHPVSGY